MHQQALAQLALLALLAGATGIGFAPILVRVSETGSTATAFHRVLFALPVLWLWMTLEQRQTNAPQRPADARDYRSLAIAGLFFAGDLAFWHWSIRWTSVANATLLVNCAPIFVTLGAAWFLSERISSSFLLAMLLSLAGAALLVGASWQLTPRHLAGDALGLIAAVFYAGYQLSVKHLRGRFSTATVMSWSGVVSAPVLLLIAIGNGEKLLPDQAAGWLVLLALALVSHVGGQGLIAYAFGHLPASFSSLSLLLQPVVAAVLAWLFFAEGVSPLQATGGTVTLAGLYLANRSRKSNTAQPASGA